MKHRITSVFGIALVAVMATTSMARHAQAAPYVEIRPVAPLGTGADPYPQGTVIDSNHITIPSGSRVWLDVYIGGWAPDGLKLTQLIVDTTRFSNGVGAPLVIASEPVAACGATGLSYCVDVFGVGTRCVTIPFNRCDAAFLDYDRSSIFDQGLPLIYVADDTNYLGGE